MEERLGQPSAAWAAYQKGFGIGSHRGPNVSGDDDIAEAAARCGLMCEDRGLHDDACECYYTARRSAGGADLPISVSAAATSPAAVRRLLRLVLQAVLAQEDERRSRRRPGTPGTGESPETYPSRERLSLYSIDSNSRSAYQGSRLLMVEVSPDGVSFAAPHDDRVSDPGPALRGGPSARPGPGRPVPGGPCREGPAAQCRGTGDPGQQRADRRRMPAQAHGRAGRCRRVCRPCHGHAGVRQPQQDARRGRLHASRCRPTPPWTT